MINFLLDTHSFADLYRKIRGAYNFISYNIEKFFNDNPRP